ncbi:hypothetical protein [Brachybacterium tyrofermentans]|uniref:hypothetical protein n=1 Tax=Brachybacterium tyrofermentans TaxID=47848 RepID=UPI003FD26776
MNRTMSEYAAKQFTEAEVRKRLSEVVTSVELVDEFTSNYLSHQDHIQRTLLGPHDGDDWEEWRNRVEEEELGDDEVILDAARVLWNDDSLGLSDAEVDERLLAVVIHVLMWGFDDSWSELYSILHSSVDEDPRKYEIAKDILMDGRFLGSVQAMLSALSDVREASIIEELDPVVRMWAMRGEEAAYPTARLWSRLLGDDEAAKYWAYKMGHRPTPN